MTPATVLQAVQGYCKRGPAICRKAKCETAVTASVEFFADDDQVTLRFVHRGKKDGEDVVTRPVYSIHYKHMATSDLRWFLDTSDLWHKGL